MKLTRDWITPLTIGSFGLLAITGVLMFFHLDSGANKVVHEWLSWLLVAAVLGHAVVNFPALKRHFTATRGRAILGLCAVALVASFVPLGGSGKPPFLAPIDALAKAPLPVLAQVAGISRQELDSRLVAAGVTVSDTTPSLASAVANDRHRQMEVLNVLLDKAPQSAAN